MKLGGNKDAGVAEALTGIRRDHKIMIQTRDDRKYYRRESFCSCLDLLFAHVNVMLPAYG